MLRRRSPPAMVRPAPPSQAAVLIHPPTMSRRCTRRRTTTPRPPEASMSSRTGVITLGAGRTARHTGLAFVLDQRDKESTLAHSTRDSRSAESTGKKHLCEQHPDIRSRGLHKNDVSQLVKLNGVKNYHRSMKLFQHLSWPKLNKTSWPCKRVLMQKICSFIHIPEVK